MVHDRLQVLQLQEENRLLREMLRAARCSCNEAEPSPQDLTHCFKPEGHSMVSKHILTLEVESIDHELDFQEDLGLVGSFHSSSKAALGCSPILCLEQIFHA